jgi:uncharacterized protein
MLFKKYRSPFIALIAMALYLAIFHSKGSDLTFLRESGSIFILTFIIGIISVPAGIGGGILFLPLAGILLPYHIDVLRGTSIIMSLTAAQTPLQNRHEETTKLIPKALPIALMTSGISVAGAAAGLAIDRTVIRIVLAAAILIIAVVMNIAVKDETQTGNISWIKKGISYILFIVSGFISGLLGMGTGWANLPILTLLMGYNLKDAATMSLVIIALTITGSATVYLISGAVIPIIIIPAMLGMYSGSRLSSILLEGWRPLVIKRIVMATLVLASILSFVRVFLGGS